MSSPSPIDGDGMAGGKNETHELFTPSTLTRRLSNVAATGIWMNAETRDQFCSLSAAAVEQAEGCRRLFWSRRGELLPLTTLWDKVTVMVVPHLCSPRSPLDSVQSWPCLRLSRSCLRLFSRKAQVRSRLFSGTLNWGHPKLGLDLCERFSWRRMWEEADERHCEEDALEFSRSSAFFYICWKNSCLQCTST